MYQNYPLALTFLTVCVLPVDWALIMVTKSWKQIFCNILSPWLDTHFLATTPNASRLAQFFPMYVKKEGNF